MKGIRRRFGFSARTPPDIDADVADEFAFHVDMRAADLVRAGRTPEEARAIALREFGDAAAAASHGRRRGAQVERRRWLARIASDLAQDLAYGWRLATRARGFSATAIVTLAVAIGGNTAVFSILDTLLFKPAPLADPATLVRVFPGESQIAWLNYRDLLARNHVFADVAASRGLLLSFGDDRLVGDAVTANFFTVLGVPAGRGRTILPSDTRPDSSSCSPTGAGAPASPPTRPSSGAGSRSTGAPSKSSASCRRRFAASRRPASCGISGHRSTRPPRDGASTIARRPTSPRSRASRRGSPGRRPRRSSRSWRRRSASSTRKCLRPFPS